MSEKKKVISVMIPTYNEEENARPIYEAVRDELVKSCPPGSYPPDHYGHLRAGPQGQSHF